MELGRCDAVANMLLTAAAIIVIHRVASVLSVFLGLDVLFSRMMDLVLDHSNLLFAIAVIIGAWWLFWK